MKSSLQFGLIILLAGFTAALAQVPIPPPISCYKCDVPKSSTGETVRPQIALRPNQTRTRIGCRKCTVFAPAELAAGVPALFHIGAPVDGSEAFGVVVATRQASNVQLQIQAKSIKPDGKYSVIITDAAGDPKQLTTETVRDGKLDVKMAGPSGAWNVLVVKAGTSAKPQEWKVRLDAGISPQDIVLVTWKPLQRTSPTAARAIP